jgi:hypothetical protein
MIPCCGEVISVAFEASPRRLTGADIRTLMDRTLWARFGEATLKAPDAVQWLSACYERLVKSWRLSAPVPLGGPIE